MICPHCFADVSAKERTGQVCSRCTKRFALDPRIHGRGMNDRRIKRIAEKATEGGRLRMTVTQLWYLSRTSSGTSPARPARGIRPGVRWLVAAPLAVLLLVAGNFVPGVPGAVTVTAAVAVVVTASLMRFRPATRASSYITPSESQFRQMMAGPWAVAYGKPLPRVVDDGPHAPHPRTPPPARPRVVILCTDHAAAVFLRRNAIPARLDALLVEAAPGAAPEALADAPAGLPVVTLHDADALGALLAPLLRQAHPDRVVVDAGLPVTAVRTRRGAVHRVSSAATPSAADLRSLAGLSGADAAWLAQGYWSPLAAVPPRRLEAAVTAAVRRALAARPARSTDGFLTWPAEVPSPGGGPSRTKGAAAG
ncbi:hypothetical protein SVEN_0194 [Streptomyces venezuelae ATCC 10712]|uniref:Uncharacterized protein n=2 Tax=Streptomyces TaxID=1883 RepID=F2R4K5_STRVP|nr:hypothetical protein vnz_00915 [Streptomyces venezuelae]QER97110.1 hypothetical protein DEJ43_00930 [Streptomyces venezuelae ATCC 10712]CCA53482.1 hypothetical protein SVEN_0194 [Streptomyces venezuelae ATCC 10712]